MYASLGLALIVVFFGYTYRKWAEALIDVPLNYISEPRYRTPTYVPAPTNFGQVFATSAVSAAYLPGAVWPVTDPRQIVEYKQSLERVAWLPGVGA